MLFKFKTTNKKDLSRADCFKGNLLQKVEQANLRLQYKFAHWLERKTAHLSRKSWIVILICFVGFTTACCTYVIIAGFTQGSSTSIKSIPIAQPTNAMQKGKQMINSKPSISKMEYEKIVHFRRYIDSLGRSPTGKKLQDSIIQVRPGLLDSLTIVENYYHSQFKN